MSEDLQTNTVLDEVAAIEVQIASLGEKPRRMVRHVIFNIAWLGALGLSFADLGYALSWIGGMTAVTVLVYLPSRLKVRALKREREHLLERIGDDSGQGHDIR